MNSHVNNPCSNAFNYLYNIRRIRKYLSRRSNETLIHSFVSGRVDYCNSLLYGPPAYQLNKLQRIQNAAARLILKEACKYKLRSDCDGLLLNPVKFKTLTTLGDRSFAAAAPQLWNSLPYAIRSSPSLASFKKTLKTFLFQKAFL